MDSPRRTIGRNRQSSPGTTAWSPTLVQRQVKSLAKLEKNRIMVLGGGVPGLGRSLSVLTESEVQRSFRKLVAVRELTEADFEKADELLDQLRPESPLRHRLSEELDELRQRQLVG